MRYGIIGMFERSVPWSGQPDHVNGRDIMTEPSIDTDQSIAILRTKLYIPPPRPWLVAGLGLVGAGLGLLFGQAWWSVLTAAAAVVSLVAILPWLRVVPPGAWGGVFLDLLVISTLLSPWADKIVVALG
jgi:hypothetical protein